MTPTARPRAPRAPSPSARRRARTDAIAGAELIVSAVTAASDVDAARSVASGIPRGAFYVDLNSVSPATKTFARASSKMPAAVMSKPR